jgi:toxin ParE1/3/4
MREIRLTPEAIGDLAAIRRYSTNHWGAGQARSYMSGLGTLFDRIAQRLVRARPADEVRPDYKRIRYRSHVVFLVEDAAAIRIVRVLHAQMDFEAHM